MSSARAFLGSGSSNLFAQNLVFAMPPIPLQSSWFCEHVHKTMKVRN